MKSLLFPMILGLFLAFLSGCALLPREKEVTVPEVPASQKTHVPPVTKRSSSSAVWDLSTHDQVTLYLKNLNNGMPATLIITRGLTDLPLGPGHWQLTGFEEGGNSYTSATSSKKFVFRVRPRSETYAGSLVIGCPKVGPVHFSRLKAMRFFNRYPFRSSSRSCEVIVGNDFASVRKSFQKLKKNRGLTLRLGF